MSITTKSLDCAIATFRGANYNDNGSIAPTNKVVLGNAGGAVTSLLGQASLGSSAGTFRTQLNSGQPILFNNSKYFV